MPPRGLVWQSDVIDTVWEKYSVLSSVEAGRLNSDICHVKGHMIYGIPSLLYSGTNEWLRFDHRMALTMCKNI